LLVLLWNQLLKVMDMSHGLIVELLIQQRILLLKRIDSGLSLSLGLLVVQISTTKLALRDESLIWCS